jgi:hypothetical protein
MSRYYSAFEREYELGKLKGLATALAIARSMNTEAAFMVAAAIEVVHSNLSAELARDKP